MKSYIAIAAALVILAAIVVCPALACGGHACCPKHRAPQGTMRNCPLAQIEKGKAVAAPAVPAPATGLAVAVSEFRGEPVVRAAEVRAADSGLYLRNCVLLI